MISNRKKGKVLALIATLALTFGLLPTQIYATAGDSLGFHEVASPEDYLLYQAVVDELNAEYGSIAWLIPYDEYEATGQPLPKYIPLEDIPAFKEAMRVEIEWVTTMNLEAQLVLVNGYLHSPEGASYGLPTADICANVTSWGVKTMLDIINREGYDDAVVRFIAERNPAFAAAVTLGGGVPVTESRQGVAHLSFDTGFGGQPPQGRGRPWVTHTLSPGLGQSKLTGYINNGTGSWKWDPASSATWVAAIFYPTFSAFPNDTKLYDTYSATCQVYYYGVLSSYDWNFNILFQQFTGFYVNHVASAAAAQNGY
ncbi:MAG: hypothetical protein LBU61_00435 [Coriobacteriales bacterium]|jgi:hypothetical protein|nr:hypothetical protein [Coriobacteriales bacterium]